MVPLTVVETESVCGMNGENDERKYAQSEADETLEETPDVENEMVVAVVTKAQASKANL